MQRRWQRSSRGRRGARTGGQAAQPRGGEALVQAPSALALPHHAAGDVHRPRVRLGGAADAVEPRLHPLRYAAEEHPCGAARPPLAPAAPTRPTRRCGRIGPKSAEARTTQLWWESTGGRHQPAAQSPEKPCLQQFSHAQLHRIAAQRPEHAAAMRERCSRRGGALGAGSGECVNCRRGTTGHLKSVFYIY